MSTSWFTASDEVKQLLEQAAAQWDHPAEAERYIEQALSIAHDNPDVLVAAYRCSFYSQNSHLALWVAEKVVNQISRAEQLPQDWEQLKPILIKRVEDPSIRLFLNAYSASSLLLAKIGELDRAKEIAARIQEIDYKREFGANTIFDILTHPVDDDD